MSTTFKYLYSILFLTLIIKGTGTTRSGRVIRGIPEWNVVVINNCSCAQSKIRFDCKEFRTIEDVSPSILSVQGDSCLLINGNPLMGFASVRFSYAWDPAFVFLARSSHTTCS
ncbi:hypothetical protein GmHk_10G028722 [Glycine max]|nr:hypothetical protein GmHk_10G028722 [Glycine max]